MSDFKCALLHPEAKAPRRGNDGDAGMDLASVVEVEIPPHGQATVSTGIALQIPMDCYARVAPRSGLAAKHGISVGAGVVDSTYRGEIKVILFNHSDTPFQVNMGDRIAQIIFEKIYTPTLEVVDPLDLQDTTRGADGFGSTGVN
jgi:dUTP pyrophosphatase